MHDGADNDEDRGRQDAEVKEHDLREDLDRLGVVTRHGDVYKGADCCSEHRDGQDEDEPSYDRQRIRTEDNAGDRHRDNKVDGIYGNASEERIPDLDDRRFRDQDEEFTARVFLERVAKSPVEHQDAEAAGRDDKQVNAYIRAGGKECREGSCHRKYDRGLREDTELRKAALVEECLMEENTGTKTSVEAVSFELGASILLTCGRNTGSRILRIFQKRSLTLGLIERILVKVGFHLPDEGHDEGAGEDKERKVQKRLRNFSGDRVVAKAAHPAPERNPEGALASEEIEGRREQIFASCKDIAAKRSGEDAVSDQYISGKALGAALGAAHDRIESHLAEGTEDQYQRVGDNERERAPDAKSDIIDQVRQLEEHV